MRGSLRAIRDPLNARCRRHARRGGGGGKLLSKFVSCRPPIIAPFIFP